MEKFVFKTFSNQTSLFPIQCKLHHQIRSQFIKVSLTLSVQTRLVVVIGDSGVGKSNLISRYLYNTYSPDSKPTIAAGFGQVTLSIDNQTIKGHIWDTAGQERFKAMGL